VSILKSLFDFVISVIGLIILSPVLMILVILMKLLMPGPIFYVQNRIGREGREFGIWKFRTMVPKQLASDDSFEAGNKSLITPFGKFLRRYKLDELPQLINVLKGEMSIVGPRPEVKKWTEVYPEKWAIVLSVKPGITDNASIEYRNEEELLAESQYPEKIYHDLILPRKLDLYIDYVNNQTFAGDILIILKTIHTVLFK